VWGEPAARRRRKEEGVGGLTGNIYVYIHTYILYIIYI
jgi:hypothetical protein